MAENKAFPDDTAYNHGSLDVIEEAEILAIAIKQSREYHEYIAAYNKLSHDEIEKLRAFKQAEAHIPEGGRLSFEDEKRIGNLYAILTLNADIKAFIEKERAVCGMLTHIFDILGDVHLFMFDD